MTFTNGFTHLSSFSVRPHRQEIVRLGAIIVNMIIMYAYFSLSYLDIILSFSETFSIIRVVILSASLIVTTGLLGYLHKLEITKTSGQIATLVTCLSYLFGVIFGFLVSPIATNILLFLSSIGGLLGLIFSLMLNKSYHLNNLEQKPTV